MKKYSLKYFRWCFYFSASRTRLGHTVSLRLFPLLFFRWQYNAPMIYYVGEETALYVSLFPGFPDPGSTVNLTWKHIWKQNFRDSQVPRFFPESE